MRRPVWALCLLLASCREELVSDLSAESAAQAISLLEKTGIGAQREQAQSGYSLWVSRAEVSAARQLLQENDLPHVAPSCIPSGLFPSPQQEAEARRACLAYSLSQRLALLDGVLSAQVLLPVASSAMWPLQEEAISSVSVLYRYQDKPVSEAAIRGLLSSSLGGSPQITITAQPLSLQVNPWVVVGPFAVSAGSARSLTLSLLALLSFGVGVSLACLSLWLRQRRLLAKPYHEPSA
jgi:type III secretory pathway lipoprotein EscJ